MYACSCCVDLHVHRQFPKISSLRLGSSPVEFADGTITGAVILDGESKNNFGALMKTAQDVRDFFGTHYPMAFGSEGPSDEIAKDFLERR